MMLFERLSRRNIIISDRNRSCRTSSSRTCWHCRRALYDEVPTLDMFYDEVPTLDIDSLPFPPSSRYEKLPVPPTDMIV